MADAREQRATQEQADLAVYEQHMADMIANWEEKPLKHEDRVWINGYRQGWLACLTKLRAESSPAAPGPTPHLMTAESLPGEMGTATIPPGHSNTFYAEQFLRERWMGDLSAIPLGKVTEFMASFAEQYASSLRKGIKFYAERAGVAATVPGEFYITRGDGVQERCRYVGQSITIPAVETPKLTRWNADFTKEPYMKISPNGEWVRFVDVMGETPQPANEEEERKEFEEEFGPRPIGPAREVYEWEANLEGWLARSRRKTE